MSLPTCLKIGTVSGLIGGLVSSAYLMGMAETAEKKDNPGTFAIGMFSLTALIGGPFIGAGAGVSYYGLNKGVKYLRGASRSSQLAVLTLITSSIAMRKAYNTGRMDK